MKGVRTAVAFDTPRALTVEEWARGAWVGRS
jgi:hypothetical protein